MYDGTGANDIEMVPMQRERETVAGPSKVREIA